MSEQRKSYNKADSVLEVRHRGRDHADVRHRVRRLRERLSASPDPSHFSSIVRQACDDLLVDPPSAGAFHLRDYVVEEVKRLSDEVLPRYLFYRYRYEVFPREKRLDDFPPCLQIEPTSICNYRCVFCYQTDKAFTTPSQGHMGMMQLDLYRRVIDQAEGRCDAVTLASRGEPLMARDIDPMLAYVHGKFLALKINTNAWFLDERKCHSLLQSGANTIVFSADAAGEPLYSRLRVNGKLDRVLANIRHFQEIRHRDYPECRTITRVSGVRYTGEQSLDDMDAFWGEIVDQVAFVDYLPWENVYDAPPSGVATPCSDLWRRMFVWWDGRVNPCDVDFRSTLSVGNANLQPLSELWRGEKYEAYRRTHLDAERGTMPPCNRCTLL